MAASESKACRARHSDAGLSDPFVAGTRRGVLPRLVVAGGRQAWDGTIGRGKPKFETKRNQVGRHREGKRMEPMLSSVSGVRRPPRATLRSFFGDLFARNQTGPSKPSRKAHNRKRDPSYLTGLHSSRMNASFSTILPHIYQMTRV